jgi:phosphoadenosine phosphosulfate reductase
MALAAPVTTTSIDTLRSRAVGADLGGVLREALLTFGGALRIASSFGVEDMVVLHEAARVAREVGVTPRVFLLDTGRLHQETFDLVERALATYALPIDLHFPSAPLVEDLVRRGGVSSFRDSIEDRKECCRVRKLEPLARALAGAPAWVTGLRREQSPTRTDVDVVERDDAHGGIVKLNPLARWTSDEVWRFVREHQVPVHALHAAGYPSIGCAPCTRAVQPGEDPRAGRWWWEAPEHKECGLHPRGVR